MSTNPVMTTNAEPLLEAVHLRKEFPLHKVKLFGPPRVVHAVEDASLALHPGHATALVGESGSGKTTLVRLLARLYTPTSGIIRYRDQMVNRGMESGGVGVIAQPRGDTALRSYRRHVQMVFQDPFS